MVGLDLKKLPDDFGNLQDLDSLDLSINKLTIANELVKLKKITNLKFLAVSGNAVTIDDIRELKKSNPSLVVDSWPY